MARLELGRSAIRALGHTDRFGRGPSVPNAMSGEGRWNAGDSAPLHEAPANTLNTDEHAGLASSVPHALRQCPLHAPAIFETLEKCSRSHAELASPQSHALGPPKIMNHPTTAPVSSLFRHRRPATVLGLISPLVVDPLDGLVRLRRSHVREEGLEVVPSITERDTSTSVSRVALAAFPYSGPNLVGLGSGSATALSVFLLHN